MTIRTSLVAVLAVMAFGCGDDDEGTEADRRGVGAECNADLPCQEEGQDCLTEFSGGYCGVRDCTVDADCPGGSACVTDPDFGGVNYCFLICIDKPDCNVNRSVENESGCVSSLEFVDPDVESGLKVCRPPMSGV